MHTFKSAVVRACVVLVGTSSAAVAQVKLAGDATSVVGPIFEVWKFGSDGIPQPTVDGASSVRVTRASQWSIPVSVVVPAWLASCVSKGSSVRVMFVPGVADPDNVTSRCAT